MVINISMAVICLFLFVLFLALNVSVSLSVFPAVGKEVATKPQIAEGERYHR